MCDSQRSALRTGITTGTCAAGAAKASAVFLCTGKSLSHVTVRNLEGHEFRLAVFRSGEYFGVVKYSGDDKADITDGARVLAKVEPLHGEGVIEFIAGEGVGTVTLPGLKVPPGEPAINPVPRKMIELAVREVTGQSVRVTISIPGGRELAERTFNPRLGILGGLSVLGTSGIVRPMNEQALLESITLEMNMIYSLGFRELYMSFAGTGEKLIRSHFKITSRNVIQCINYPGHVLYEAVRLGFEHVIILGHPGKLLKVASGSFNTHSKISDGRLESLCTHLAILGAPREVIISVFNSNTTAEAIDIVKSSGFSEVWEVLARRVSFRCRQRALGKLKVSVFFADSDGEILGGFQDY